MISELLLLSKNDIPFIEAQVNIHQPTISEISFISEESFHIGCRFLIFSSNMLSSEDKTNLENKTDFEIFMSIMNSSEYTEQQESVLKVLTLLFPFFEVYFSEDAIILRQGEFSTSINKKNFKPFQEIVTEMFDLNSSLDGNEQANYNPADKFAARIADKLNKRKEKLAQKNIAEESNKISVFSRYISILAVGERKDFNNLLQYTVYQLKDEFKRYQLKREFDLYLKAKLAGAQDLEEVEDWMKDIHS